MTKRLRQLEAEREALTHRLEALQQEKAPVSSPHKPNTTTAAASRETLPRPSAVKRLQEEITSILDTSDLIKTNIASALEQSQLNDTRAGVAGMVPNVIVFLSKIVSALKLLDLYVLCSVIFLT